MAALTLPTLIANYQKKVTVNKVKKFYTMFSQAIIEAESEHGAFSTWTFENNSDIYKYLKPYLKTLSTQDNIQLSGNFSQGIKMIFADGTQAICSHDANIEAYGNAMPYNPCIFFIHAIPKWNAGLWSANFHNIKKPSHEVFWFLINEKGQLVPPHMEKDREYNLERCTQRSTAGSSYTDCATLIMKDNWEIRKDYPW